jgi:glucose-fructose oxidoreductase
MLRKSSAMNLITNLLHLHRNGNPVRFAVVGLGNFAQTAILPAFANTDGKAQLVALVTGDVEKAAKLSRKYKAPAYSYDDYEGLLASRKVDAVYVATPNSEHRAYAEPAAHAGVHVLCEKPLAYSVEDARAIVNTCQKHKVRLMTAYRLHFEEGNLAAIEAAHSGKIGEARLFTSVHTMQVEPDNIRVHLSLGGGPLEDIGIYCLNAARYIFKAEPEGVTAFAVRSKDRRFKEVPEAVSATLRFPKDRLATFLCGFGETKVSEYQIIGTEGILKMDPAFTWQGDIEQTISHKEKFKTKTFKHRDQIAAEIIYFSDCIRQKKNPEPSGREGLLDVRIIDALRKSYLGHRTIKLRPLVKAKRPHRSQPIKRSPARKPAPVKAPPPSKE